MKKVKKRKTSSINKKLHRTFDKYFYFVKKDIYAYSRGSFLGVLWTFILPLVNGLILLAIFTSIFHRGFLIYLFYMWPALYLWDYFVSTTSGMCTSVTTENVKLTTNPNLLFPLSKLFNFLPAFLLIYFLILIIKVYTTGAIPYAFLITLVPSFIIFILFTLGIGLFLAAMHVFFRDINHIWSLITRIAFFVCPIIYPERFLLESKYWFLIRWNPMLYFIQLIRNPLVTARFPPIELWSICIGLSILFAITGLIFFQKFNRKFIHFM